MGDKCEKCSGVGYINDELSGTLICDCTFLKAGFGRKAQTDKTYIGDGVYASTCDGVVCLTTENGMMVNNRIYLDNDVLRALVDFLKKKGLI